MEERSIARAIKVFEDVENARKSCDITLSHLARNRRCQDCGKDFMPKSYEPCPQCGSKDTRMMKSNRKCRECGHRWEPASIGQCVWCGSTNSQANPKDDPYLRNTALPRLRGEEKFYEDYLIETVMSHPVWQWAKDIKGLGPTTLGRIVGKTDIVRVNTVSEFWSHCGFGLGNNCQDCKHFFTSTLPPHFFPGKEKCCPKCGSSNVKWGIPQHKRKGQTIDYDAHLQSNCVMMGESLMKAGVRKRCGDCHSTYSSTSVRCVNCGEVYSKTTTNTLCPKCGEKKVKRGICPFCNSKNKEEYAITPYGQFYLDQKAANASLPEGHRHNRAFRHMIKLCLSHLWEMWRKAEGLDAPEPYAFAILHHPESHRIRPEEMLKSQKP